MLISCYFYVVLGVCLSVAGGVFFFAQAAIQCIRLACRNCSLTFSFSGNEDGEPVIADRQIRISENPLSTARCKEALLLALLCGFSCLSEFQVFGAHACVRL